MCKKEKASQIVEEDVELQMIELLEGYEEFEAGDNLYAAKNLVNGIAVSSISWAPKAALMAAYVYYAQDYYFDAESELKRFIKTYPKQDLPYAHFLLAMCYYEKIVDEKRIWAIVQSTKSLILLLKIILIQIMLWMPNINLI